MADLSLLSTDDLMALKSGDLSKVSTEGLTALKATAAPAAAPTVKPETMAESLAATAKEAGPFASALGGVGVRVNDAAMRLKQLVTGSLTPSETADIQAGRQLRQGSVPATIGSMVPDLLAMGRLAPASFMGNVAAGGAASAATEPVLPGESTLKNAAAGGAAQGIGYGAMQGLSRIAQPIVQSAPVQALLRHGVVPTPGQAAGPNSFAGTAEQKLASLPLVGSFIQGGRNRAGEEFNRAAINQAVPAGQAPIRAIGNEGLAQLDEVTRRNYERLLSGVDVQVDPHIVAAVDAASRTTRLPLSAAGETRYAELMNRLFFQRIPPSGSMPAATLKSEIIGDLGHAAQQYRSSGDAEQRALGTAIQNARNEIQQWMLRQSGAPARDIAMADTAYAANRAVNNAGDRAMARGGEFSPLQLLRQANPGSATERLAAAGQAVLPGTIPNSGTADRALLASLLGVGATTGASEYFGGPGYLGALGLAPLLYSRAGSRYAIGDLLPAIQGPLSAALSGAAPIGGALAGAYERNRAK